LNGVVSLGSNATGWINPSIGHLRLPSDAKHNILVQLKDGLEWTRHAIQDFEVVQRAGLTRLSAGDATILRHTTCHAAFVK